MLTDAYRTLYRRYRSKRNDPYGRFLRDGGDELLVSNLNLANGSWVIDFGGFRGDWTAAILDRYNVRCIVVEPVPQFANHISERFSDRTNVQILPFVVGRSEGAQELYLDGEATGSSASGSPIIVNQQPISRLVSRIDRDTVGVASINIEGGEYELLEVLMESGEIVRFNTLLIQFHQVKGYSPERYLKIQLGLAASHNLSWDYPYIWQRWDKKQLAR